MRLSDIDRTRVDNIISEYQQQIRPLLDEREPMFKDYPKKELTSQESERATFLYNEMEKVQKHFIAQLKALPRDEQIYHALRQVAYRRGDKLGSSITQDDLDKLQHDIETHERKQEKVDKLVRKIAPSMIGVTDALGKGLDPKIARTVALFNKKGFTTTGSCEGHLRWASPAPYVDVRYENESDYRTKYTNLKKLIEHFNKGIKDPLKLKLQRLYSSSHDSSGSIRVTSLLEDTKARSVFGYPRAEYLHEAQKIMDKFAEELDK